MQAGSDLLLRRAPGLQDCSNCSLQAVKLTSCRPATCRAGNYIQYTYPPILLTYNYPAYSGVTPIGQGWTNIRGLRGLGATSLTLNFVYVLIFQMLDVSHLFYSTADFFVNVLCTSSSYNV